MSPNGYTTAMQDGITIETAETIADTRMAPIRNWAAANHGSITRMTRWLTERTGQEVHRQTVSRWLQVDPEKRQIPHYGWGLLLEEGYAALA